MRGAIRLLPICMVHSTNGPIRIVADFRLRYRGVLTDRASQALDKLGQNGRLRLKQLETLLSDSIKVKQFKPGQAVGENELKSGRLSQIAKLARSLDLKNGVRFEAAFINGNFKLLTTTDSDQLEVGTTDPHAEVIIQEHPLGIFSYNKQPIILPADSKAEDFSQDNALYKAIFPEWIKRTLFSNAETTDELFAMYFFERINILRKAKQQHKPSIKFAILGGVVFYASAFLASLLNPFSLPWIILCVSMSVSLLSVVVNSSLHLKSKKYLSYFEETFGDIIRELNADEIARLLAERNSRERENVLNILEREDFRKATMVRDRLAKTVETSVSPEESDHPRLRVSVSQEKKPAVSGANSDIAAELEMAMDEEAVSAKNVYLDPEEQD